MCGASQQEKDVQAQQAKFYSQLTQNYAQVFGESSGILQVLKNTYEPIIAKGVNQAGFSDAELQARNTAATENVAQQYNNAQKAVGERMAAAGGGNQFLPSGSQVQVAGELASAGANQEANELNKIQQEDYATGRDNYWRAAAGLAGGTQVFNPSTAIANPANTAGSDAFSSAHTINQEGKAWMGPVFGAIGGLAAGPLGASIGSKIGGAVSGSGGGRGSVPAWNPEWDG